MGVVRAFRGPEAVLLGAAACIAIVLAAILAKSPAIAIALVGVVIFVSALGIDALIVVTFLGAIGMLPFVNPESAVSGNLKLYAVFGVLTIILMFAAYLGRGLAGKRAYRLPLNLVSIGVVTMLFWVILVGIGSHPVEARALSVPFFILPLAGVAVMFWLSQDDALVGLYKMLPLVVVVAVLWALNYDAGAAGCNICRHWVGTGLVNKGILGPDSRLYTAGQNSFLGLFLIWFAYTLHRPSPGTIAATLLGAITIGFQDSRMQYIAVGAGMVVLLIWEMGQLRPGRRVMLLILCGLVLLAIIDSPFGSRAISAYTEFNEGVGTGVYRLKLIENTAHSWTLLGQGFSKATVAKGFDIDLGLPNTLLVLGYVGAFLQLLLLCAGIWRGMAAHSLIGATVASVLLMVLISRPSLPLIEYGHSAMMYGAVLGFAVWLPRAPRREQARAPARLATT